MKHAAALALLVLGGNESPSKADLEKFMKKAGVTSDADELDKLVAAQKDKKFHEQVKEGLESISKMGSGPAAAGPSGAGASTAAAVEEKVEEEAEDIEMGNLFGGDDEEDY